GRHLPLAKQLLAQRLETGVLLRAASRERGHVPGPERLERPGRRRLDDLPALPGRHQLPEQRLVVRRAPLRDTPPPPPRRPPPTPGGAGRGGPPGRVPRPRWGRAPGPGPPAPPGARAASAWRCAPDASA